MSKKDIRELLKSWDFDPENTIRVVGAEDGSQVLQVRLPLGIEQYELDGRPDGKRFESYETLFDREQARLNEYIKFQGSDEGFTLGHETFVKLQNEGILFYYRYLLLFQISDYERVIRDTDYNLALTRFVASYAEDRDDAVAVLQFQPYMIRMNAVARSMRDVQLGRKGEAIDCIKAAIQVIEDLESQPSAVFQFERSRSLSYLNSTLEQIQGKEADPLDQLENELGEAVSQENYERAAMLRDQIRNMQRQ